MFNIEEFKSRQYGILKTNHFKVEFQMPPGLIDSRPNYAALFETNRDLQFRCDTVNFPMTGVEVYGNRRYGYGAVEKRPSYPTFGSLSCTFICDREGLVQKFFHEWLKIMANYDYYQSVLDATTTVSGKPMQVYEMGYKDEYAVDIIVTVVDTEGYVARKIRFRDSHPIAVPDINLSWGQLNELVKIPVVFTFTDWHDIELTRGQN